MGEAVFQIPVIKLSGEAVAIGKKIGPEDEEYRILCSKVREACENYGCFIVQYDESPKTLHEDILVALKALFDLPEETKKRYQNPKPYCSYSGSCPRIPLHESFGIDEAHQQDKAHAFTNLMWPEGNLKFCETMKSMSSKMLELNHILLKMIFESFGVSNMYDSHVEDSTSLFRVMKYKVPSSSNSSEIGLVPHTDKNALTVLCQINEVQGLEILSKEGQWIQLLVPKNCFIVMVGDTLKAWSNGRLHSVRHRVVMSGKEERYSCAAFTMPKEDATVVVPEELVNKENPRHYRPFKYADYLSYFVSSLSEDALEIYAGI